jgi:arsenite-transporting ATPase
LSDAPAPVPGRDGLHAAQLDAEHEREAFLQRWRDVLVTVVDRGTYLDTDDAKQLIDATLPGGDESFAVLRLAELARDKQWTRVVLDTAPTGHTLRLLALPQTIRALMRLLDAFQEKHRALVRALTHRYRADDVDRFLAGIREQIESLETLLRDGQTCAAVVVSRPEKLVIAESVRLCQALGDMKIRLGAVVLNAARDADGAEAAPLKRATGDIPWLMVPVLEHPPASLDGARTWAASARLWNRLESPATLVAARRVVGTPDPGRRAVPALRPLTIIGGKGGVGKTSVSCALAVASADAGHSTLIVSTDPAPSVADAFDQAIGDDETVVEGANGLVARQLDAAASFERFRREYGERVGDAVRAIAPLTGTGGSDALEDLLALAPPGIDEIYALASLGDALNEKRFSCVIVDPAPTGHLLRLLELPPIALHWTHELMRMLLKYKEVARIGDAAEGLLDFARSTRAVQAMLRDRERSTLIVVALDEPLVRDETARLIGAVRKLDIRVGAVAWNRASETPATLAVAPPIEQYQLPETDTPPRGVEALRQWLDGWRAAS